MLLCYSKLAVLYVPVRDWAIMSSEQQLYTAERIFSMIRLINSNDYDNVLTVVREAFWDLHKSGCEDHLLVNKIVNHSDFIPELSFVIEKDGEIVGSIFYTHSKVIDDKGNVHKTITFGPVCILPSLHRQGLGRALITHSINEAKRLGFNAIVICGFPYHYQTYGFEGAKKYGISMQDGKFYTGLMALPLYDGALDGVCGSIYFSDCMEVDSLEAEEFDKKFPYKEKRILPCQAEFEKAVAETDEKDYAVM